MNQLMQFLSHVDVFSSRAPVSEALIKEHDGILTHLDTVK